MIKPPFTHWINQLRTALNTRVPEPGVGDANKFLRGDGYWATPTGGGGTVGLLCVDPTIAQSGWEAGQNGQYTYTYTNQSINSSMSILEVKYDNPEIKSAAITYTIDGSNHALILTTTAVPSGSLYAHIVLGTDGSDVLSDVNSLITKVGNVPSGSNLQGEIDALSGNINTIKNLTDKLVLYVKKLTIGYTNTILFATIITNTDVQLDLQFSETKIALFKDNVKLWEK